MAKRDRVPNIDIDPAHYDFLASLDRRRLSPVAQVSASDAASVSSTVAGTASTVASTAATNSSPFGFSTQAQADAIVTLLNELRAWAVAQGFIKGSA